MTSGGRAYVLAAMAATSYDVRDSRGAEPVPVEQGHQAAGVAFGRDDDVIPEPGTRELLAARARQQTVEQVGPGVAEGGPGGLRVTVEYDVAGHRLDDGSRPEQVLEGRPERPVGPALAGSDDRHGAQRLPRDPVGDRARVA